MQLNYKTRGKDISPQGKPRVYFCCHPDDFATFFEDISAEILNLENCAIFYDEQPNGSGDKAEWESRLSDMQLFVMPVTSKLLAGNNKGIDDYHIAIEKHIPVLPLMQEKGLDQIFNSVCGNLQYLDKYQKDDTAISYQEKLKNFVDGVLVGDEEAKAIRGAFRSYIFLSYRKKDRAHAQRLMRLIHKSEICRDVAIWYDEYLVPGEDFNNAIGDALNKSQLFLLAVTPNLVCEPNYVQAVEYPMALNSGKLVLPVEMCSTDPSMLGSQYANLPRVIKETDEQALLQTLADIFPQQGNLQEDLSRYHLLALAYLDGVDVEVDHSRALSMLNYCADKGHANSVKVLVDMYKRGKGVARDLFKAIEVQQRLVELLKMHSDDNEDAQFDYAFELINLGNFYEELRKYDKSIQVYEELRDYCKLWEQKDKDNLFVQRVLLRSYNFMGDMHRKMFNYEKARGCFMYALYVAEQQADKGATVERMYDLAMCYCNLGRCHEDLNNHDDALTYYENRLEILNAIVELSQDDTYVVSLLQGYMDLFDLCQNTNEVEKARDAANHFLPLAEKIAQEQNDAESQDWLLVCYSRMASLSQMEGDFIGERDWYLKALEISIELTDKYDGIEARQTLAQTLESLSDNARTMENFDQAEDYILKALYLRETIAEAVPIAETQYQLSLAYISAAMMYNSIYQDEPALEMLFKAEALLVDLVKNNPTAYFRLALADCYYRFGNVYDSESDESRQSYEKGLQVMLDLYAELKDEHTLAKTASFYHVLADRYEEEDSNKALEYYKKALEIEYDYAKHYDSVENWRQCMVDMKSLGVHYYKFHDDNKNALEYLTKAFELGESLLKRTDSAKVRSSFANVLDAFAEYYSDLGEHEKAIFYYHEQLEIHKRLASESQSVISRGGMFTINYLLGELYVLIEQFERAKQCQIASAMALIEYKDSLYSNGFGNDETVSTVYQNVAKTCYALDEVDEALSYYQKALEYARASVENGDSDRSIVTDILRKIAEIYQMEEDYQNQLEYALLIVGDSLAVAQEQQSAENLGICAEDCQTVATCYLHLEEVDNAVEYLNIARELFTQCRDTYLPSDDDGDVDIGEFLDNYDQTGEVNFDDDDDTLSDEQKTELYVDYSRSLAEVNYRLGVCYHHVEDFDNAIEYLAPAIEIGLELSDLTDAPYDWFTLAQCCFYLGQFAGVEPLEKAEEILQMLLKRDPSDNKCKVLLKRVLDAKKNY